MKITINSPTKDKERITFDKLPAGMIFSYAGRLYIKQSHKTIHPEIKEIEINAIEIGSGRAVYFSVADGSAIEIVTHLTVDTSPYLA